MKRRYAVRPLEIKAADDEGKFSGYGSVFDVIDSYHDIIVPGAFEQTIEEHKKAGTAPALLWQHQSDKPIGVWEKFSEDETGLLMEGQLLMDVQLAKEAKSLIKAKAVRGLSIGFTVPKGGEEYDKERNVWIIKQVNLWETSIVTFPANKDAQIQEVKHLIESGQFPSIREFERYLMHDAGFSRSQARTVLNDGYKSLLKHDAEDEISAKIDEMIKELS